MKVWEISCSSGRVYAVALHPSVSFCLQYLPRDHSENGDRTHIGDKSEAGFVVS